MPLRLEDRGPTRAFWRSHFEVWELSGLTQREYCEKHGLNLKNFGNWRGQLKREDAVGPKARWGRYPRLRPSSGPSSRPSSERPRIERPKPERLKVEKPAPTVVTEPGRRRRFSEDAKRRIVEEKPTNAVWNRIGSLLDQFSPTECASYIRHAGYGPT